MRPGTVGHGAAPGIPGPAAVVADPGPQRLIGQSGALREARFIQLGAQVVVVEHELGPVDGAERQGDRPEYVGRVTGLDDPEPAGSSGLDREPRGRGERVPVLDYETELSVAGRVRPVFVELHAVDHLISRVPLASWADHGHLMAVRDECLALEPYAPVKRHRKVLDDDEDAGH
jgi:hypothetical protein